MSKRVAILVLLVATGLGALLLVIQKWNLTEISQSTEVLIEPTTTPAQDNPDLVVYESEKLGVRFTYLKKYDNESFAVSEIGNKIFIHTSSMRPSAGQYVEVWDKPEAESLRGSIQRMFLNTSNPSECFVEQSKYTSLGAGWEVAEIAVPRTENEGLDVIFPRWEKCPTPYTTQNGIAFFAMNNAHPNKLMFFNIGQYGIYGNAEKLWQDTVEVF